MERSYQEWLPEDHPVYILSEIMDRLDLSAVTQVHDDGEPESLPYDPRRMVELLLYAYALGILSSREIARQCVENVAFRVVMASDLPDFRAIRDFRQRHLSALPEIFFQVLRCYRHIGLGKLGSLDLAEKSASATASKPKGKGSRRKRTDAGSLETRLKDLLARAQETDAAEDLLYGPAERGDEVPAALTGRERRLQTICEALTALGSDISAVAPKVVEPTVPSDMATDPSDRMAGPESTNAQEDVTDHKARIADEPTEVSFTADPAPSLSHPSEQVPGEDASIPQPEEKSDVPSPVEAAVPDNSLALEQALAECDAWIQPTAAADEPVELLPEAVEVDLQEQVVSPDNGQADAAARKLLPPPTLINRALKDRAPRVRMPEQSTILLQLREIKLLDLSVSGALIEHTIPVRIGNLYRLSIPIEGYQIQVWARAIRAYASHFVGGTNGEKHVVYRTGMVFVRLEQDVAQCLGTYVDRLLAEGRGVE